LLKGVVLDDGTPVVDPKTGRIDERAYDKYLGRDDNYKGSGDTLTTMNAVGAGLVSIWVYFFFLLILGFGYSFFWSASTIVYFLMRKRVDDAEMDEVYLEEDEDAYSGPLTSPAPAPAPPPPPVSPTASRPLTMVEPPVPRPAPPPEPPPPAPPPVQAAPPPPEPEPSPPPADNQEPPPAPPANP
jgi:hypothetical protein